MRNMPFLRAIHGRRPCRYPIVPYSHRESRSNSARHCLPTITPLGLWGTGRAPTHGVSPSWASRVCTVPPADQHRSADRHVHPWAEHGGPREPSTACICWGSMATMVPRTVCTGTLSHPRSQGGCLCCISLSHHGPREAVCAACLPSHGPKEAVCAACFPSHGPKEAVCAACFPLSWTSGGCMRLIVPPMDLRRLYAPHSLINHGRREGCMRHIPH